MVDAVLTAAGFRVAVCPLGEPVLRTVRDEAVVAIVVAAAQVPDSDERVAPLVGALRDRPEPHVRDVGIVVIVDDAAEAAAATPAGADATVGRPVDPARLVAAVTEVCSVPADVRRRRRP